MDELADDPHLLNVFNHRLEIEGDIFLLVVSVGPYVSELPQPHATSHRNTRTAVCHQ